MAPQPSTWRGSSEQISLAQVGCEARKIPAEGEVFFLDFYLYRTIRELSPITQTEIAEHDCSYQRSVIRRCGSTWSQADVQVTTLIWRSESSQRNGNGQE